MLRTKDFLLFVLWVVVAYLVAIDAGLMIWRYVWEIAF